MVCLETFGLDKRERYLYGFIFRGTSSRQNMAALGSNRAERLENSNLQRSSLASPEKVRELLNEGVSSTDTTSNRCSLVLYDVCFKEVRTSR